MMSSSTRKKKVLDAESEDSNSASSKPENDKQHRMRWSDTSSTTNEPSSASATVATTVVTRHRTAQSAILPTLAVAAVAAAPAVSLSEKKPKSKDEFLPMLRIMLDRESQNDSATVQWSADGSSFIVTDHIQFEEQIIPTYFNKPIVFSSFLRKLYRWGFKQLSSRRTGRYEFGSLTFTRLDAESTPAVAAAAAAATDTSIQVQQQPTQAPPLLQQQVAMAQSNQPPVPNPMPNQADANAITGLLSNTQRQRSSQQPPSIPSQQSVLNQSTNQPNAYTNGILQSIMGSNQQPLLSQNSVPTLQPVLSHANQLNTNLVLQPFQQWQPPQLDTAPSVSVGSQAPFSDQLMGYSSPSTQSNAVRALVSLYGMSSRDGTFPNTNTTPAMSQHDIMYVQTLLMLMHRLREEELQRRAQADAIIHNLIIATTGLISEGNNMIDEAERQNGLAAASIGSTGGASTPNVPLGSGMTVSSVPCNIAAQPQQAGTPPPSAGNLNIQSDSIAAILQAARRGDARQLEGDVRVENTGPDNIDNEDGNDGGKVDEPLSPRKRKSPDEGYVADDDDSWDKRLRPRKKSPRK